MTLQPDIFKGVQTYRREGCKVGAVLPAVAGAAVPVPSCGPELNELEESIMVINAAVNWNLGRDKPFTPAELCFHSQALTGLGLGVSTLSGTTSNNN